MKFKIIYLSIAVIVLSLVNIYLTFNAPRKNYFNLAKQSFQTPSTYLLTSQTSPVAIATPNATLSPSPTPSTTKSPNGKILFGIGSQAGPAMDYKIVKEAPVHMLSSWYNGTKDLEWMRIQQNDLVPRLYKNHFVVHLITWTDLPEEEIQTKYGAACGRPYPVSSQVVDDMKQLAQIYNGPGPMYVSLFTEFPSFTCVDNNWNGNENYWNALKDNYRLIKDNFHKFAPNSKVSISWGGWLSRYDDKVNQGGKSLIPHFADILKESDFSSFQSMEDDQNVTDILEMTRMLGQYKRPVMLSHYKPPNDSETVFNNDISKLFSEENYTKLVANGLFAVSLMDSNVIDDHPASYNLLKSIVQKWGK